MTRRNHPRLAFRMLAATVGVLGCAATQAQSDDGIKVSISGYGTTAALVSDESGREFTTSTSQGRGVDNRLDVGLESRFGLQGVVRFDPQVSLTAQMLARRSVTKEFDIAAEWLYGQYTPMAGLDLRLGRVVLPVFLISDSRFVGYSQPWLWGPTDVYRAMPLSSVDGVQALWSRSVGNGVVSAQASYGSSSSELLVLGAAQSLLARDVANMSLSLEWGSWTARLARTTNTAVINIPLGPSVTLAHDNKDEFISLGGQYDDGRLIALAEWTQRTENDVPGLGRPLADTKAWYLAAGWRFGALTPMVRYSERKDGDALVKVGDKPATSVSLRYEFARNVSIKAQWEQLDATNGAFVPAAPAAGTGDKVNVFGIGADFVF